MNQLGKKIKELEVMVAETIQEAQTRWSTLPCANGGPRSRRASWRHPASAAGPDLRQILLGSEGRMGIITRAAVRTAPLPEKEEFRARIPMGRYGNSLREVASVIAFLASDGASYITGQNIRVDGVITRSV